MFVSLLLCSLLAASEPNVEVQPLTGDPVSGVLTALDAKAVTVDAPEGRRTFEVDKLLGLSVRHEPLAPRTLPTVWLELVDGSALLGTEYRSADGTAQFTPLAGAAMKIPLASVRSVRFQPETEALAAQWQKTFDRSLPTDVLLVKKGDALDYHQGVVREVSDDTVRFELDGEVLPVKRAKAYGLAYHQTAGRELPAALGVIRETSGAAWTARSLAIAQGDLQWITPAGLTVSRPWAALARIDFSRGKLVQLSDLKPESVEYLPFFPIGDTMPARNELFAPGMDRNLAGGPLQLDGRRYAKGLALHSRSTLVYRLPDRFRRFTATAGIDDSVRPQGDVRLVIRGDDRVLLDTRVSGAAPPQPVDLDVTGVRRLTILVDFGNDLDVADHLVLAEAKLVK